MIGEIMRVLDPLLSYEIVYVDDGSDDATGAELAAACARYTSARVVRHRVRCGQSARPAQRRQGRAGRLGGDARWRRTERSADIPALLEIRDRLQRPNVVVNGVRPPRRDTFSKRFASASPTAAAPDVGRWRHDTGCGIRLFPRARSSVALFRSHAPLPPGAVHSRRRRAVERRSITGPARADAHITVSTAASSGSLISGRLVAASRLAASHRDRGQI